MPAGRAQGPAEPAECQSYDWHSAGVRGVSFFSLA